MTTIPAALTDTELADWLTEHVGDPIANDFDAARQLLTVFDLASTDGPSLNNPHHIASSITTAGNPDAEPLRFGPIYARTAAVQLVTDFRITRKPDDYARFLTDLPMPAVVSRHQCPFCRRYTRADARQVTDHMSRCWQNPGLRCCKTCVHHQDASGTPGGTEEWLESCTLPEGPEYEDYRFPVLHCPLWQTKKES